MSFIMKHKKHLVDVSLISVPGVNVPFNVRVCRESKPKYGREATLLRNSHEYIQKHTAPDFWAMMPYYTSNTNGAAPV